MHASWLARVSRVALAHVIRRSVAVRARSPGLAARRATSAKAAPRPHRHAASAKCGLVLALASLGCGVNVVELAPHAPPRADVVWLSFIDQRDIQRFRAAEQVPRDRALTLLYPDDSTLIPENLAPLSFLFGTGKPPPEAALTPQTFTAFELSVSGPTVRVLAYTSEPRAELPEGHWRRLLADGMEHGLTVQLRAIRGEHLVAAEPVSLRVWRALPAGEIQYWSDVLQRPQAARIEELRAHEAAIPFPLLAPAWQSLGPGGRIASCSDGSLAVSSADQPATVPWSRDALHVEHAVWSPDGEQLVFALTSPGPMEPADTSGGTSIATVSVSEGVVSAPELQISSDKPDESLRYPSFSHDGRYLVFERGKRRDTEGSLWLLPLDGGEALQLDAQATAMRAMKLTGSMPSLLPGGLPEQRWLMFTSDRAPGAQKLTGERQQLWAVALYDDGAGLPSLAGAPFWLPFQSLDDDNRRPLFHVDP